MSPEQIRGHPVDKTADIWAFGCVLFEMIAGRTAFAGDTVSDTIVAILERSPDWSALPAETPPHICQVLSRCLQKDPKRRWRDIADVRIALEDAATAAAASPRDAPHAVRGRARERLAWAAMTLVAAAAVERAPRRPGCPPRRIFRVRRSAGRSCSSVSSWRNLSLCRCTSRCRSTEQRQTLHRVGRASAGLPWPAVQHQRRRGRPRPSADPNCIKRDMNTLC